MAVDEIYRLYADMKDIAEQQLLLAGRIVNDPECGEEMLILLERRQAIIDRIDMLSAKNPDYSRLITDSNEHSGLIAIINAIQEYDQQSRKLVESGLKQIGDKLGNVQNNIKAYDAYLPSTASTEGWFFDRKK